MAKTSALPFSEVIKVWEWVEWDEDLKGKILRGWIYKVKKEKFSTGDRYVAYFITEDGDYKVFILTTFLKQIITNLIEGVQMSEKTLLDYMVEIAYQGEDFFKDKKIKIFTVKIMKKKFRWEDFKNFLYKPNLNWKINPKKIKKQQKPTQEVKAKNHQKTNEENPPIENDYDEDLLEKFCEVG